MPALLDVVVVSYNSARKLRTCVMGLAAVDWISVTVVDNASDDGSLETIRDLPLRSISGEHNDGFARGCNQGWRAGRAPFVLFLNPDASIDEQSLERLVEVLQTETAAALVGPRIVNSTESLEYSQRRFPRLRSTFSTALFLHRLAPSASWADEVIRDERAYERAGAPDWVSGACMLVRRSALEELGGLDERFFLYSEDTDLCRRLWSAGHEVRFEPNAVCRHAGGASAPRSSLLPLLAESRIRYTQKHYAWPAAWLARFGVGLGSLTHMLVARGGHPARAGHASSLRLALTRGTVRT